MAIEISKHCRLLPAPEDGTRILVMRYWPRGVKRDQFHSWMPVLAPSKELLKWCKADNGGALLERAEYYRIWRTWYVGEMLEHFRLIEQLRQRHEAGETITLLCGCHDPVMCHRSVLGQLILR